MTQQSTTAGVTHSRFQSSRALGNRQLQQSGVPKESKSCLNMTFMTPHTLRRRLSDAMSERHATFSVTLPHMFFSCHVVIM